MDSILNWLWANEFYIGVWTGIIAMIAHMIVASPMMSDFEGRMPRRERRIRFYCALALGVIALAGISTPLAIHHFFGYGY